MTLSSEDDEETREIVADSSDKADLRLSRFIKSSGAAQAY